MDQIQLTKIIFRLHPEQLGLLKLGDNCCKEKNPEDRWFCTRVKDHIGPHADYHVGGVPHEYLIWE